MTRLAYDSATGGMCPRCRKQLVKCRCAEQIAKNVRPVGDGVVRVRREVRNGKPMTAILGLPLRADELAAFAAKLKAACGSGGTAKDGVIEIQGEHVDGLVRELTTRGFKVKRAC